MTNTEFDPVEFINKSYAEATHYELNDTLSTLSKSIARTQQEGKALITEHFSKFIECRVVMEEVWSDIQRKNLDKPLTGRIEEKHQALTQKYSEILSAVKSDEHEALMNERKARYLSEYAPVFSLKEDLTKNMHNFESFVAIYENARRAASDVSDSKFIRKCFDDVQPLVREFLDRLYIEISSSTISFEDACYYFELYFAIRGGKTEKKILNTLLVNFKESVCSKLERNYEQVGYLLNSLRRILKHTDGEIAQSALKCFYECACELFDFTDTYSSKIILLNIQSFGRTMGNSEVPAGVSTSVSAGVSADSIREFFEQFSSLKLYVFRNLLERCGAAKASEIFDKLKDLLDEKESNEARSVIVQTIISTIKLKNLTEYEYLAFEAKEVEIAKDVLGPGTSPWNRRLRSFLKEQKNTAIVNIARRFENIVKEGRNPKILMEVARIIVKAPTFYSSIIFEAKNSIKANPVIYYFLANIMKMERPIIDDESSNEVTRLKGQFGFLLEKIVL